MEATGRYHVPPAEFLHGRRLTFSALNAAGTQAYALSHISRDKTDKTDVLLLTQDMPADRPPGYLRGPRSTSMQVQEPPHPSSSPESRLLAFLGRNIAGSAESSL